MTTKHRVLVVTGGQGPGFSGAEAIAAILADSGMKVTQAEESSAIMRLDSGGFDCVVLTPNSHFTEGDALSLEDFVTAGGGLVAVRAPGSVKGRADLLSGLLGCKVVEHSPAFAFKVGVTDPSHPIAHR